LAVDIARYPLDCLISAAVMDVSAVVDISAVMDTSTVVDASTATGASPLDDIGLVALPAAATAAYGPTGAGADAGAYPAGGVGTGTYVYAPGFE
jgi:hypothetical protein